MNHHRNGLEVSSQPLLLTVTTRESLHRQGEGTVGSDVIPLPPTPADTHRDTMTWACWNARPEWVEEGQSVERKMVSGHDCLGQWGSTRVARVSKTRSPHGTK